MEKLSANFPTVRPSAPEARGPASRNGGAGRPEAEEFRAQLSALSQQPVSPLAQAKGAAPALKFSNHAIDRMQSRGIRFSPEEMGKIQGAVAKAAGKGSRESLLITDNAALIVSVKDNTVVTVLDKASLKENVFTNIDSTVMI